MNHPPTAPIRLLLEAAAELTLCDEENGSRDTWTTERALDVAKADFMESARNCIPALTALVNEREKVRALIAELRKREVPEHNDYIDVSAKKSAYEWCADALSAIVEGK